MSCFKCKAAKQASSRSFCWFVYYRALHFCAKRRGIASACRLFVCPSVRPSVRLSVTLVDCDHIGWNSSEIISPLVSLGCSLFATPTCVALPRHGSEMASSVDPRAGAANIEFLCMGSLERNK